MDFAFSDEQEMLRNSARELMGDRYPRQRIAAIADGRGFDRAEWKWIIEVGWAGISVPEDEGGSGLSFFEELLLTADLVVVLGAMAEGTGVWALDRDGQAVRWRELPTVDRTRKMGEIDFDGAPADLLGILTAEQLLGVRDRALAALSAEATGVGAAALELGVDHARSRTQFGRAIGAFQAVSHQLAQAYVEVETARSLAYWSGWAVSES